MTSTDFTASFWPAGEVKAVGIYIELEKKKVHKMTSYK